MNNCWPPSLFSMSIFLLAIATRPALTATIVYDFVPDQSSVRVTGGFAGINERYSLMGSFGLDVNPESRTASFSQVNASTVGTGIFGVADLNQLLNMQSLRGVVLDNGNLEFTGTDRDGADLSLLAIVGDNRIQLQGGNNPGCCDFFNVNLETVAVVPEPSAIGLLTVVALCFGFVPIRFRTSVRHRILDENLTQRRKARKVRR